MADEQYKISLGITLDDNDLSNQIRGIRTNERIRISVELNDDAVQTQIANIRRRIQELSNIRINLGGGNGGNGGGRGARRQIDDTARAYRELISLQNRIGSKQQKVAKLDTRENQREILELSNQIDNLVRRYQRIHQLFNGRFSDVQLDGLNRGFQVTSENLDIINRKVADTRAELARGIELKLTDGTFANETSNIESKFRSLSNQTEETRNAISRLNQEVINMALAADTGDIDGLINANERYETALKAVQNQLQINARAERDAAAAQKLDDSRNTFMSNIDAWLTKNSAAVKKFGSQMLELKAQAKSCDQVTLNHLKTQFRQLDKEAEAAGLKMQTFGDRLRTQFSKYSQYFSVASMVIWATQGLKDMFEQVKLIDSAMTELKKVTDESDASYNKFLSNAASRSKEIGTTIDGLVSSTADFARLGYGFEDAQGLAEVANIYAVVGDEIEGVEGATESLISTMAAFKGEMNGMSNTDFAMSIIDIYNELGNSFAISSGGLGEALERSASSLAAANNSLHESAAMITAANEVTQDPQKVGKMAMPTQKMAISVKSWRQSRPRKDFISIFKHIN